MNIYLTLFFILCLLILGSIFEDIFTFKEIKKIIPPNTMMSTKKGNIFLISKGNNSPTVVFLPSVQTTSPYCDFYKLQEEVSKFTQTAIYESYGYGFSEESSIYTSLDEYVENLRFFLKKCNHKPPYIFVSYSTSSLQTLHYSKLYPNEVLGIIFEDAVNPNYINNLKIPSKILLRTITFFKFTGIIRLILLIPSIKKHFINSNIEKIAKLNKTLFLKNLLNENILKEIYNLKSNSSLCLKDGIDLNRIPIRIITSSNQKYFSSKENCLNSQEAMLTWSKNSSQIIVKNSKTPIHCYDTEIFIKMIKELLATSCLYKYY